MRPEGNACLRAALPPPTVFSQHFDQQITPTPDVGVRTDHAHGGNGPAPLSNGDRNPVCDFRDMRSRTHSGLLNGLEFGQKPFTILVVLGGKRGQITP
jgi:hypothetical protein